MKLTNLVLNVNMDEQQYKSSIQILKINFVQIKKYVLFFFFISLIVTFFSCNNHNDGQEFVGKWININTVLYSGGSPFTKSNPNYYYLTITRIGKNTFELDGESNQHYSFGSGIFKLNPDGVLEGTIDGLASYFIFNETDKTLSEDMYGNKFKFKKAE